MSTDRPATRGRRLLIGALAACVIAFAVQQTAIVPAIQDVQRSLHASKEWTAWLVTVYLMVATVATPVMGRLADLHGRRRVLLAGLLIFALASAGAALAPNLAVLLAFRAAQGIGGAVYPLTLALARNSVDGQRQRRVIALLAASFGAGTAAGFVGGGALADYVTWRAIFAVGAALVVLAWCGVARWVGTDTPNASGGFDTAGTVILAAAAIGLLVGLTLVVSLGIRSPVTITVLVITIVASAVWVRHERRTADPLVDLHVLVEPRVAMANVATVGMGWALFSSFLLVPEFARTTPHEAGYGLAAGGFVVGLLLLPQAIGQMVAAISAGRIPRLPSRLVFAAGMALVAAGEALLAVTRSDPLAVAGGMLLIGAGSGLALESSSSISTRGVGEEVAAVSASLNSTVRRLARGVGGQVSTLLLAALTVAATGLPTFGAYMVSYSVGGALCVLGGVAVALRRAGASAPDAENATARG